MSRELDELIAMRSELSKRLNEMRRTQVRKQLVNLIHKGYDVKAIKLEQRVQELEKLIATPGAEDDVDDEFDLIEDAIENLLVR